MTIEVWMYVKSTAWDVLDLMSLGREARRAYMNGVTGFWNEFSGGFTVYNVIGTAQAIDELKAAFAAPDVHAVYAWVQGPGLDNVGAHETVPNDILAVMKDHKTYDQDGNELTSVPATFGVPNWGHVFLGQKERVFAGDFSSDFSEEYF